MTWETIVAVLILAATGATGYFVGRWRGWQAGVLQAYLCLRDLDYERYQDAFELMSKANHGRSLGTLKD